MQLVISQYSNPVRKCLWGMRTIVINCHAIAWMENKIDHANSFVGGVETSATIVMIPVTLAVVTKISGIV